MITIESTQVSAPEHESPNEWRTRSERHRSALAQRVSSGFGLRTMLNKLIAPLGVKIVQRSDGLRTGIDVYRAEEHHSSYGRPWCIGRDHFEHLVSLGMKKTDRLLDIGCGALRTGIWVIDYLEEGRYHGIEAHLPSLQAAVEYEIPLHGLEPKRPVVLHDSNMSLDHWKVSFDWIFAFSVFRHLPPDLVAHALKQVVRVIATKGRLLVNHGPPVPLEVMSKEYGLELVQEERKPCRHAGGSVHWFEFTTSDSR